mmetsp:Transcript_67882/g.164172  ORF Transcript_67882/g.164172 Transcript_67882/m.164172 type:complete len:242 (-) Transcript_67882:115-840(-)
MLPSTPQPCACTPATCGCAPNAVNTTSITPASAADCLPPAGRLRARSRSQAFSATRASAMCARSAATASASPIVAIAALLGGASCGAGPTRCRCRRPPSCSSPSIALMRPRSSWFCACSGATSALSSWHSDCSCWFCACSGAIIRWHIAKGQAESCAACSDNIPAQPQPAAAAAQAVGTCGQAARWAAFAPRVVASPQCSQLHSRAAIARSAALFRLAWATGWRHSGQRRGSSRRFQQSAQ